MDVFQPFFVALKEIALAFGRDLSIWWLLAPIFVLWVAMEFYFGEYKHERLGFSSAMANGISLLWIVIVSLRIFFLINGSVYYRGAPEFWLLAFFALYAMFLIYISFGHLLSEKVVHYLASPSLVYFFSVAGLLWGHGFLNFSIYIIVDLTALLILINLIFWLIKKYLLGLRGEVELVQKVGEM